MTIDPNLIPIALFYLLCATLSCIGNGIMILVFLRERKMKSPCHYMITFTCTADMLHLCAHFVFNYQLFMEEPKSQAYCFWILTPSIIGLSISSPMILALGIDRFLACQSPVLYRNIVSHPMIYLLVQMTFPILFTSYLLTSAYSQRDSNLTVICQIPLAFSGTSFEQFNEAGLLLNCLLIVVYFVTYIKLRSFSSRMKSVFKSIFYTVLFVLLGWCTVTICNILGIHFIPNTYYRNLSMIYAGIGLNMACASNVFVFYAINSEYRDAIRRLFGKYKRTGSISTATGNLSMARTSIAYKY